MRIVSLLPSATEIVCALGLRDDLVGVSHECDFPAEVIGLPTLTEPKIDPKRDSAAIDTSVRALVQEGLSVYRIRTDILADLKPDLIVTQQQCEVCAVSYREVAAAAHDILDGRCEIVSLEPMRLDDIFADIERVASATRAEDRGRQVTDAMRDRLARIRDRAAKVRYRPRVACLEWLDPLMAAANWIPELIEICGAVDALDSTAGGHSRAITWQELEAAQADVIVLMPCGFPPTQTMLELPQLKQRPEWPTLPAVRNRRVYVADGNAYFNRPGPRIVESAELLAGLMHPGLFASGMPKGGYVHVA